MPNISFNSMSGGKIIYSSIVLLSKLVPTVGNLVIFPWNMTPTYDDHHLCDKL